MEFTQKGLINFHFKTQWDTPASASVLILNYVDASGWGPGQYLFPNPFPLNVNQTAEIHILVRQDTFVVFVNGAFLCEFKHVLPFSVIDNINVYNGFKLRQISV